MPRETEPMKRHTRRREIFTQQLLLRFSSTLNNSTNQTLLLNLLSPMALPRGLINSHKFITYNHDEVTRAKQQNLETRSDGLRVYLTPEQVGPIDLFLVEKLIGPIDCHVSQ